MNSEIDKIRVLYSFPLRLGVGRITTTAWYQIDGLGKAGAKITVYPSAIAKTLANGIIVTPTLALGKLRLPVRLLGRIRTAALHDRIVAHRLEKIASQIDIIHTWPIGALETLKTAKRLGIPTVLERCNAHTRFGYEVVQNECKRLGVELPPNHEHAFNHEILKIEEEEYRLAYRLLCPSDFVVKTFLDRGFKKEQLVRHIYGVDEHIFYPDNRPVNESNGITMLSVGVCAVRKGLHYALQAWIESPASKNGRFLIAGEFLPAYAEKLSAMLAHPSVKVLGHRNDVQALMRESDILVLSSIEEGFGLVCTEAMASGCVPLVSNACTELCVHGENSLVHPVGDVNTLRDHISLVNADRKLLGRLRTAGLKKVPEITWDAAGKKLLDVYREVIGSYSREHAQK